MQIKACLFTKVETWKLKRSEVWLQHIETGNHWTRLPCPFNVIEFFVVCFVYLYKQYKLEDGEDKKNGKCLQHKDRYIFSCNNFMFN